MNMRIALGPVVVALVAVLCTVQGVDAQVEWTYHDIAVPPGKPGSWNESRVLPLDVVFDGTEYHLFLIGGPGVNPLNQSWSVGHWTSADIAGPWTPDPCNPVLTRGVPGEWDAFSISQGAVLYHDGIFKMWYAGNAFQSDKGYAGYATNADGYCLWDKHPGNPLAGLVPGSPGAWDENGVFPSSVLFDGSLFHMWYTTGTSSGFWNIGHATSIDGIDWTKGMSPVLQAIDPWEGDRVFSPEVVPIGHALGMWFGGWSSISQTGYAVSPNGLDWGRWPDNPILVPLPGGWSCDFPTVILEDDLFHGWVGTAPDVHYVTSPFEVLLFDGFESGDTMIWGGVVP